MIGTLPLETVRALRLLGVTVIKLEGLTLAFDGPYQDADTSEPKPTADDERASLFDSAED